jgi:hypothetical protein
MTDSTPPGWYEDPAERAGFRWWDGERWTQHRQGATEEPGNQQLSAVPVIPVPPTDGATDPGIRLLDLAEGETVVLVARPAMFTSIPAYIVTLGLYEFWRRVRVYAVTSQRLIERKGLLIFKSDKSLPLYFVQDASFESVLIWGRVAVSTAGGPTTAGGPSGFEQSHFFTKDRGRALRDAILRGAHLAREEQSGKGGAERAPG